MQKRKVEKKKEKTTKTNNKTNKQPPSTHVTSYTNNYKKHIKIGTIEQNKVHSMQCPIQARLRYTAVYREKKIHIDE